MIRYNRWYHLGKSGNKSYLNGKRWTWWRKLIGDVYLTILIICGREEWLLS